MGKAISSPSLLQFYYMPNPKLEKRTLKEISQLDKHDSFLRGPIKTNKTMIDVTRASLKLMMIDARLPSTTQFESSSELTKVLVQYFTGNQLTAGRFQLVN